MNLYPWRENNDDRRKKKLWIFSGVTFLVSFLLILISHFYLTKNISQYSNRNQYLIQRLHSLPQHRDFYLRYQEYQKLLTELSNIHYCVHAQNQLSESLQQIGNLLPENTQLTLISRNHHLWWLKGIAQNTELIDRFIQKLSQLNLWVTAELIQVSAQQPAPWKSFLIKLTEKAV